MIDWPGQIARGRRLAEALLWLGSAVIVALVMAMGTALALWLPPMQGRDVPESPVMVIDLTTLPPAPVLAEQPEAAPPAPPTEPAAEPAQEPQPELQPAPEPEAAPDPEPALRPDPTPLPVAKPDPAPPAQAAAKKPEKPAAKPKPTAKPKPAKPQATAKAEPPKATKPGAAKPAQAGGAAPARGTASPDALAAWKRKVATQLDRHLRRKSFGARPAKLTATLRIDGAGSIIAVSLAQPSGDATLDARVTAALAAKGRVAAPPDGQPATLTVPVALR